MDIRNKVKEIIESKNESEFQNLVNHLKYTHCKSVIEIREILASNGMHPAIFDELIKKAKS